MLAPTQAATHERVVAAVRAQIAVTPKLVTRVGQRTWRVDAARQSAVIAEDDAQSKTERIVEWRNALSTPPMAPKKKTKQMATQSIKPEGKDWENISSIGCDFEFPPDTSAIHALAENYVRPYLWPPPDIPTRFPGAIALKSIITQYLLSLDFGSRQEVSFEKKVRIKDHLPKITSARQARATIINILPIINRVAADARTAEATPRSRLPCDTMLVECLRTEDSRDSHIRCLCRTSVASRGGEVKRNLAETVFKAYMHRVDTVDLWFGPRRISCRDALLDASVLDARPSDICDTVAFVSIPDVFDFEHGDQDQLQLVEDFRIIGQRSWKDPPRVFAEDYHTSTRPSLEEGFDVVDPVLRRVREKSSIKAKGARTPTASASKDARAETPGQYEHSDGSTASAKESSTEGSSSGSGDLQVPFLWLEDCSRYSSFEEGFGVCKVYNFVVFALVTAGSHAHLLCGWGTESSADDSTAHVNMHISDVNCPVWDLRDTSQVIRLCAFLIQLRDKHTPKVREAFEAKKDDFKRAWNADPTALRLQWTIKHQKASSLAQDIDKERQQQKIHFEEVRLEREEIGRAMKHSEEAIIPDTDVPAYVSGRA
ncbi:hypothetical protein EV121DRAFT_272672 [Schizophyllum commune]